MTAELNVTKFPLQVGLPDIIAQQAQLIFAVSEPPRKFSAIVHPEQVAGGMDILPSRALNSDLDLRTHHNSIRESVTNVD